MDSSLKLSFISSLFVPCGMDTDTLIEPRIKKKVKVNHFLALRKEVDKYFKENKISENGNAKFLASAIVIVVGYLTCYLTIYLLQFL